MFNRFKTSKQCAVWTTTIHKSGRNMLLFNHIR